MIAIALILAIIIAIVVSAALIFFMRLYWQNPEKATKLLATIALFYRSTEKTRKHQRQGDVPREHQRAADPDPPRRSGPRKSLLMTITDVLREDIPAPPTQKRRKSDP